MTESATGTDIGAAVGTNGLAKYMNERNVTVYGIGRRFGARLLDTVLVGFLSMVVAVAAGLVGEMIGMFRPDPSIWGAAFTAISGLVFSLIYYVGAWASSGQTLGDTLVGVKIVRTDGSKLSVGRAIVRYFGYLLSALALSLGFIWIAFDKRRQGWHDKIAGTVVMSADQSFPEGPQPVNFVPEDRGGAIWIIAWVVLALLAPGALFGGLLTLGPFVNMAIRALRGG